MPDQALTSSTETFKAWTYDSKREFFRRSYRFFDSINKENNI